MKLATAEIERASLYYYSISDPTKSPYFEGLQRCRSFLAAEKQERLSPGSDGGARRGTPISSRRGTEQRMRRRLQRANRRSCHLLWLLGLRGAVVAVSRLLLVIIRISEARKERRRLIESADGCQHVAPDAARIVSRFVLRRSLGPC
jgi:hypothetical protein